LFIFILTLESCSSFFIKKAELGCFFYFYCCFYFFLFEDELELKAEIEDDLDYNYLFKNIFFVFNFYFVKGAIFIPHKIEYMIVTISCIKDIPFTICF